MTHPQASPVVVRSAWTHLMRPPLLGFCIGNWQPQAAERWVAADNYDTVLLALGFPNPLYEWLLYGFDQFLLSSIWVERADGAFAFHLSMVAGDSDHGLVTRYVHALCVRVGMALPPPEERARQLEDIKGKDGLLTDEDALALYLGGHIRRCVQQAYGAAQ